MAVATNSRKDLGAAAAILVAGANLTESDPVLALDVIKALRSGRTVIGLDPRATELATKAEYHLPVKPGTDLAALRAMLRIILDEGLEDAGFIAENTAGFATFQSSLAEVDVAAEAAVAGIDVDTLRAAAAAFGRADAAAIIFGRGVTEGPDAADTVAALADLALLTGNLGRPGTGLYPLRSGANSQGLADMGVHPALLPGGRGGAPAGLTTDEIVPAIEKGEIDALMSLEPIPRWRWRMRRECAAWTGGLPGGAGQLSLRYGPVCGRGSTGRRGR